MFRVALSSFPGPVVPALAALFLWKKEKRRHKVGDRPRSWRKEVHPYYNLHVTILRGQNINGTDLLSNADCYVQLKLPTSSPNFSRTKVVYNSKDPEWNETFHYRIHGALKNTLELTLYDRDVVMDDKLSSIVFDVGNIKVGQIKREVFKLNPKDKSVLEVEFKLEERLTPVFVLRGEIKNGDKDKQGNQMLKLSVPGSYEKHIYAPLKQCQEPGTQFMFHADREFNPNLKVCLQQSLRVGQNDLVPELEKKTLYLGNGSVPISSLPEGKEVNMSLPLSKEHTVHLSIKKEESNLQELDIRLGFQLSSGETDFLEKRKHVAAHSLKKSLGLFRVPNVEEVPVVAVLGSGGGTRAMTSFYGSLLGLQELGLLDSITYLSGVSGSTWCMSTLYEDPDWSQKELHNSVTRARQCVTSNKTGAFSAERLKQCTQELVAMEKEGHKVNFSDLWGLVLEYYLHQKDNPAKLSDQHESVLRGQNPYPIYAGINVRANLSGADFAEWCEFTPHEVGFRKYGAFIRTEDFGSEFFMGHLIHRRTEPKICYLQGVWGSAFAANLDEIWARATGTGILWLQSLTDVIRVVDDRRKFNFRDPSRLQTRLVMPTGVVFNMFKDFFKSRFTAGERYNFTRGLYLYKDYKGVREFLAWKGNHLDAFPNQLTPMEENLYLVDGGFSINSPFPLVLQPERDVDVILSFNYSWQAPFEVLHLTKKYCKERRIPFPSIHVTEEDEEQPKECYVFMDDNPSCPVVIHFPLVNDTFHTYKAPGVLRETEKEKEFGNFELSGKDSPYRTKNFTYKSHDFDRLLEVNRYNVLNNKENITMALRAAMDRRKHKRNKSLKKK